jgi:hypothetical protein
MALLACLFFQHVVAQNTNLSAGLVFDGEPYIAQNPVNSNHLVVAWMGFVFNSGSALTIKTKTSFDGGLTWSPTVAIPHVSEDYAAADPSLAIADNGDVLLCYIDHQEDPYGGGVYFRRSQDGGLTWGEAVLAIDIFADGEEYPIDRPWFGASADGQWIYLTSMPPSFVVAPNRPYLFQSFDGGATWTSFQYLDGEDGLVGNLVGRPMAAPAVGTDFAYTIYPSYVFGQNPLPTMIVSRQAMGSDQREYFQALSTNSTSTPGAAKMGYKLLVNPANEDQLTALFVAGDGTDLDIQIIDSYNAGASWTEPVRINDDPVGNDRMQDLVWADYDSDGDLCVAWRDRRNADSSGYEQPTEIFCAYRLADATDFSANFALTQESTPHNALLEQNGNDFMSLALQNDTLHAVWGSTTDGSLDIWYARRALGDLMPSVPQILASEQPSFHLIYTPEGVMVVADTNAPIDALVIHDLKGRLIEAFKTSQHQYKLNRKAMVSGVYVISATFGGTTQSIKAYFP